MKHVWLSVSNIELNRRSARSALPILPVAFRAMTNKQLLPGPDVRFLGILAGGGSDHEKRQNKHRRYFHLLPPAKRCCICLPKSEISYETPNRMIVEWL